MVRHPPRYMTAALQGDRPLGPNGKRLCRNCETECQPPRKTFCGQKCIDEWNNRANPAVLRQLAFERDQGVCQICRLDVARIVMISRRLYNRALRRHRYHYRAVDNDWLLGVFWRVMEARGFRRRVGHFWEADHIVPVVEGGGCCGVENIRTLCYPCHRVETQKLLARRREERKHNALGGPAKL